MALTNDVSPCLNGFLAAQFLGQIPSKYPVSCCVQKVTSALFCHDEGKSGSDVFDIKQSEIGELLYRLKYRGDLSAVSVIVEAIAGFLGRSRTRPDLIVSVPPSGRRQIQPVLVLARVSQCAERIGFATPDHTHLSANPPSRTCFARSSASRVS